ncbi:MAG: hypothetical protein V7704_09555 [Aurantimonas endophytica]|uniref:hypothetical protein n=1 Tax=Aurantimonas endophytica TaxID=1522175 RepID=UPI00300200EB
MTASKPDIPTEENDRQDPVVRERQTERVAPTRRDDKATPENVDETMADGIEYPDADPARERSR